METSPDTKEPVPEPAPPNKPEKPTLETTGVMDYVRKREWEYTTKGCSTRTVVLGFSTPMADFNVKATINKGCVCFWTILHKKCPTERLQRVAYGLSLINSTTLLGGFYIDTTGHVTFEITLPLDENDRMCDKHLDLVFDAFANLHSEYHVTINKLIWSDEDVQELVPSEYDRINSMLETLQSIKTIVDRASQIPHTDAPDTATDTPAESDNAEERVECRSS